MDYVIRGQVIAGEKRGVLGLSVQLWDESPRRDTLVAETITDDNGEFVVTVDSSAVLSPEEARTFVNVVVLDRYGTELYRTDETPITLEKDPDVSVNVRLPHRAVKRHLARPLTWQRTQRGLIKEGRWADIRQALQRLAAAPRRKRNAGGRGGQSQGAGFDLPEPGTGEPPGWFHTNGGLIETAGVLGGRGYCPAPDPFVIDALVDDAWQILDGNPDAIIRFADTLDLLSSLRTERPIPMGDEDNIGGSSGPEVSFLRSVRPGGPRTAGRGPCSGCHKRRALGRRTANDLRTELQRRSRVDAIRSGTPDLLDEANATALFFAAAIVGQMETGSTGQPPVPISSFGHGQSGRSNFVPPLPVPEPDRVTDVLGLMCAFSPLLKLQRAALGALGGDAGAMQHLDRTVALFDWGCGPDDGPIPDFGLPPKNCLEVLPDPVIVCAIELAEFGFQYSSLQITDVTPSHACEGEVITIHGSGFGLVSNRVLFREVGELGYALTGDIVSWGKSRIEVRVPARATCGVRVKALQERRYLCDRLQLIRPSSPTSSLFLGGAPSVKQFALNGSGVDTVCVAPGSTVPVTWDTCATNHVRVEILNAAGAVQAFSDPALPSGSLNWVVPALTQTQRFTARIVAAGDCDPSPHTRTLVALVTVPAALTIDGLEVTQGIQYYHSSQHLTDAADRAPDNSARLVRGKSAWVRVYLRSGRTPGFDNGDLTGVTGTLEVERRVGGTWSNVTTLNPNNAPVTARDAFANHDAERGDVAASLNFRLPATQMRGMLRLTARVTSLDACVGAEAEDSVLVDVNLQQTLQIAAVAVGYNGPDTSTPPNNVTFAAPTNANIANDAGWALTIFPVGATPNIRVIATVNATAPLNGTVPAGGCDPNWNPILADVQNAQTNDGNRAGWFYYGFVNASIPRTHGNTGCANGGVAAGLVGGGQTTAHEAGHQFGLPHAPCGAVGTANANYPLYEPYDNGVTTVNAAGNTVWSDASIGEYGWNINNGTVRRPAAVSDFMSYCGSWISLYSHNFLTNNAGLNPLAVATGASSQGAGTASGDGYGMYNTDVSGEPVPRIITIIGSVLPSGEIDVTGVSRVSAQIPMERGRRTAYTAELIDDDGQVLASAPVFSQPSDVSGGAAQGCAPCTKQEAEEPHPPFRFRAVLLDVAAGAELRLRRGEEVEWRRRRPASPPTVANVAIRLADGRLEVTWKATGKSDLPLDAWLQWSGDEGKSWHGLAVGVGGERVEIDPGVIPAERVQVQVLIHDGFSTSSARSDPIELPPRPPCIGIVHPQHGGTLDAKGPLHLWGELVDAGSGKPPDLSTAVWKLGGREVARGLDEWIKLPQAGEYELTLTLAGCEPASVTFAVSRPSSEKTGA